MTAFQAEGCGGGSAAIFKGGDEFYHAAFGSFAVPLRPYAVKSEASVLRARPLPRGEVFPLPSLGNARVVRVSLFPTKKS